MHHLATEEAPTAPPAASTSTSTTLPATSAHARILATWAGPNTLKDESRKIMQDAANHGIELLFDFFAYVNSDGTISNHNIPVDVIGKLRPLAVVAVLSGSFDDSNSRLKKIDTTQETVRKNLANEARFLCENGFDGVQLDIEGIPGRVSWSHPDETSLSLHRTSFNRLAKLIRQAIGNKHFSLALPDRDGTQAEYNDASKAWADYPPLAEYVDYLIPMCYNPPQEDVAYQDWVSSVTRYSIDSVKGRRGRVLLGVSVEVGKGLLSQAMTGIRNALASEEEKSLQFSGLSVFSYERIGQEDWRVIDRFQAGS
jgi:spore germination protein YaaH